jgi:phospholipid-translocating ATPase
LIDGISLSEATKIENRRLFMKVALKTSCVCCCRCAPSQKQTVTSLLKKLGKRVLGIGDGGNDVGMIQEAHVGVGIEGKEGKQAALASDYSIKEFQ